MQNNSTLPPKGYRATARAIIIRDGKVLLFERSRRRLTGSQHHYYSVPGGGIDPGETPEQAVVRELNEEMLVEVRPLRLLVRQATTKRHNYHHYFHCEIVAGEPQFNTNSEEGFLNKIGVNRYTVSWIPLESAASRMQHEEYTAALRLIPELLADPAAQTVDITT